MREADRQAVRLLWICAEEGAESAGGRVAGEAEREAAEMAEEHTKIEDEDADEDADEGHREVMHMHDPKLPSKAEVLEHQLTLLPYRTWCPQLHQGKGQRYESRDPESGRLNQPCRSTTWTIVSQEMKWDKG